MSDINETKKKITNLIAEINPHELACLILEGSCGVKRPKDATAVQALAQLDEDVRHGLYVAAHNALRLYYAVHQQFKPAAMGDLCRRKKKVNGSGSAAKTQIKRGFAIITAAFRRL